MSGARKKQEIFLHPGEHFVGDANYRVRTLLGSCVSITLWHPGKCIGAMSHFLLPSRGARRIDNFDGHFGDEAMWLMLRELARAGVAPPECEAKIFGGGDMFPLNHGAGCLNVGKANGEAAQRLLRGYAIPVISECLYGEGHRQVIFDIATGHVWSRQINPIDNDVTETRMVA
jgi:chemotaxis protein CheD